MKRRLFGIDLIKAVAIILIILIHLSQIIDISMLSPIFNYIIFIGVGLFVFASGFLLYSYNPNVEGWQGIGSFFKKRLVRIFPLYWVALMFAFIVTPVLFYQKSSIYIPDWYSNIHWQIFGIERFLVRRSHSRILRALPILGELRSSTDDVRCGRYCSDGTFCRRQLFDWID